MMPPDLAAVRPTRWMVPTVPADLPPMAETGRGACAVRHQWDTAARMAGDAHVGARKIGVSLRASHCGRACHCGRRRTAGRRSEQRRHGGRADRLAKAIVHETPPFASVPHVGDFMAPSAVSTKCTDARMRTDDGTRGERRHADGGSCERRPAGDGTGDSATRTTKRSRPEQPTRQPNLWPSNIASARFGVTDPAERTAASEIAASAMVRIGSSSLFTPESNALHFMELNASTNPECARRKKLQYTHRLVKPDRRLSFPETPRICNYK
jgi:hypothetical protein